MANLKNLIGKALNRATSSSNDDGGKKKKKGFNARHEEHMSMIQKTRHDMEKMRTSLNDKRPDYNTKAPASAKTPKPAPIQAAKEKRDKIQATFGGPKQIASRGGTGMKTELSPAYKESKAADVKRLTKPGGLKSELTQYERSLGRSRKEKFRND
jgi:hypothetical protein